MKTTTKVPVQLSLSTHVVLVAVAFVLSTVYKVIVTVGVLWIVNSIFSTDIAFSVGVIGPVVVLWTFVELAAGLTKIASNLTNRYNSVTKVY